MRRRPYCVQQCCQTSSDSTTALDASMANLSIDRGLIRSSQVFTSSPSNSKKHRNAWTKDQLSGWRTDQSERIQQ